jgi:Rieske Fe-S protein
MQDSPRRLLLRVTLKLLSLTALLIIAYALLSGDEGEEAEPRPQPPLQIELNSLKAGSVQRIEWAGGPLQLLRLEGDETFRLFYDRGGNLGCPLAWQAPGSTHAPQQPWPGGFRDQCSGSWYRYDGTVLPDQEVSQNLQSPPHRLLDGHLLQIGVNGDNAAPVPPAVN